MPLATPTGISIVNKSIRLDGEFGYYDGSQFRQVYPPFGGSTSSIFGLIKWTNNESQIHSVKVTVTTNSAGYEPSGQGGQVTDDQVSVVSYLDSGATQLLACIGRRSGLHTLGSGSTGFMQNFVCGVKVQLIGVNGESNEASASITVDMQEEAAYTQELDFIDNQLVHPTWRGFAMCAFTEIYRPSARFSAGSLRQGSVGGIDGYDFYITDPIPPDKANSGNKRSFIFYGANYPQRRSLPATLVPNELYLASESITPTRLKWLTVTSVGGGGFRFTVPYLVHSPDFSRASSIQTTKTFLAPQPDGPFTAEPVEETVVKNRPFRFELIATHRAVWEFQTTPPTGVSIQQDLAFGTNVAFGTASQPRAFLVGSLAQEGNYTINLRARKFLNFDATTETTATLNVVASLPRTTIAINSAITRDAIDARVGAPVNIALAATPSPARWQAVGLPTGLSIDQDGAIGGSPTQPGSWIASVTAQASGPFDVSLPLVLKFNVGVGATALDTAASRRVPWLLTEWTLTDLQVIARSRQVESTFFESGNLRIKLGDDITFAVFFVGANDAPFALAPTALRVTVRAQANFDDVIVFKATAAPPAIVRDGMTYYELAVRTGNKEREIALEWLEQAEEPNAPLPCVADLDWTVNGKIYSSRSFPVLVDLDVTRP